MVLSGTLKEQLNEAGPEQFHDLWMSAQVHTIEAGHNLVWNVNAIKKVIKEQQPLRCMAVRRLLNKAYCGTVLDVQPASLI